MRTRPFLLHALSPLHAGTGHSTDIIDLPIARMRATGIPFVPGSSIKGVLRHARREVDGEKTEAVFGPSNNPSEHSGALVVGDARLLALPVRSFLGTFAWATSPLLLALAKRDLENASLPIPTVAKNGACVTPGSACVHGGKVYVEDVDLSACEASEAEPWAEWLSTLVSPGLDIFSKRFVVVHDDTMAFFWETATQVDARVRLGDTRTVAQGALWLEESLPPEALLIGLLAADRSRRRNVRMTPEEVLEFALESEEVHQLGGKGTIGRGRCRFIPVDR